MAICDLIRQLLICTFNFISLLDRLTLWLELAERALMGQCGLTRQNHTIQL